MSFTRCPDCGALDGVPWSRGHSPKCAGYIPPTVHRRCPLCGEAARVDDVDIPGSHVIWRCTQCREVWGEQYAEAMPDEDEVAS